MEEEMEEERGRERQEESRLVIVGHFGGASFEQLWSHAAGSTCGLGEATLCCTAGYPIV